MLIGFIVKAQEVFDRNYVFFGHIREFRDKIAGVFDDFEVNRHEFLFDLKAAVC
jgi:hypothetical protein